MYKIVPTVEVLSFDDDSFVSIIGFLWKPFEKRREELAIFRKALTVGSALNYKTLGDMLCKSISFIHLWDREETLYTLRGKSLTDYILTEGVFGGILAKFENFLTSEENEEAEFLLETGNTLAYLIFKEKGAKKEIKLSKENKVLSMFVDFSAADKEKAKQTKLAKLEEREEESELPKFELLDLKEYRWELYEVVEEIDETKFPLFKGSKALLDLQEIFHGFSSFEGALASPMIIEGWKAYYQSISFKSFMRSTLNIQAKLGELS